MLTHYKEEKNVKKIVLYCVHVGAGFVQWKFITEDGEHVLQVSAHIRQFGQERYAKISKWNRSNTAFATVLQINSITVCIVLCVTTIWYN